MAIRRATLREAVSPLGHELPASLGQLVLEACPVPMVVFESVASGCLLRYANPAFARRTGYSAAEVARAGWDGLHMDGGRGRGPTQLCAAIRERREIDMPVRIYGRNGVTFSAALHVSPLGDSGADAASYAVGVLREGAADAEYLSRLEHNAYHDPLTGLPNRRLLAERARQAIAQALREDQVLGIALVDLDGFKLVNDELGHAAGDQVLCTVGARLARDLRPGDLVARVGGDEFVLLLREADGDYSLRSVVERVRHRIEQPIQLHGQSVTIACSIGIAVLPDDGEDLAALLRRADRAMYRQKALHRSIRSVELPTRTAPASPAPPASYAQATPAGR